MGQSISKAKFFKQLSCLFFPLLFGNYGKAHGKFHIFKRRKGRDEVVMLKINPIFSLLTWGSSFSGTNVRSVPSRIIFPSVAFSIVPIRARRVDFPEPEGPIIARSYSFLTIMQAQQRKWVGILPCK